jgi:hypothetical protein
MTIANKLGPSYEAVRAQARIKTITVTLNDVECELKVRIPVKREMDAMIEKISAPDVARVDAIYEKLSKPLRVTLEKAEDGFIEAINAQSEQIKITDDDVVVNGTSVRQIATMSAIWQTQVENYFALLQTPTGEPVNESFDEISEEFPETTLREIIKNIDDVIKPKYNETKKN